MTNSANTSKKYAREGMEPEYNHVLGQIAEQVKALAPDKRVDPLNTAAETGLDVVVVMALLRILEEEGLGALMFQVNDEDGMEAGLYRNIHDLPEALNDKTGRRVVPSLENVKFRFVPAQGMSAPLSEEDIRGSQFDLRGEGAKKSFSDELKDASKRMGEFLRKFARITPARGGPRQ